jgi:hypothetical protein
VEVLNVAPGRNAGVTRTAVRAALAVIGLLVLLGPAAPASAADSSSASEAVSASQLKAAFVFNFAKFAEWPSLAADAAIQLCVFGDDHLSSALAQTAHGQLADTHPIVLVRLAGDTSARACHILFVSGADRRRVNALVEEAASQPILTVGDTDGFCRQGGMIELFFDEGRMRFAVNVDVVQRSHLRLSSRLLGLAKIVRDGPNAQ